MPKVTANEQLIIVMNEEGKSTKETETLKTEVKTCHGRRKQQR